VTSIRIGSELDNFMSRYTEVHRVKIVVTDYIFSIERSVQPLIIRKLCLAQIYYVPLNQRSTFVYFLL
jgi:hypothetical protein